MRLIGLAILTVSLALAPLAGEAQQQTKTMPRVGFLTSGSLSSNAAWIEAFRQGIVIEYRIGLTSDEPGGIRKGYERP